MPKKQGKKAKKAKHHRVKVESTQMKTLRPSVQGYEPVYDGNPVTGAIHDLQRTGQIELPLDDRTLLGDKIVELVTGMLAGTGFGASQIRVFDNWLKGRQRHDVVKSITNNFDAVMTMNRELNEKVDRLNDQIKILSGSGTRKDTGTGTGRNNY